MASNTMTKMARVACSKVTKTSSSPSSYNNITRMSSTVYSNDRMEKDEDKKKEDEVQEINKHTSVPDPLSASCKRTTNNEWICTDLTKEKLEEAIPDKTEREKFLNYVLDTRWTRL